MTYNEWRDELKSNLLSVSDSERRRVLDYYAEAYADRRDAGYSEREIIEDFGAPYDAAHRILSDGREPEYDDFSEREPSRGRKRDEDYDDYAPREKSRDKEKPRDYEKDERKSYDDTKPSHEPTKFKKPEKTSAAFVLLCIIFAIPIFTVVMTMVGITIGFCVAPFGVLIGGVSTIGAGIGSFVGGHFADGLCSVGAGLIIFGVSIILIPLFFKLVKLMWKLFTTFFGWLKRVLS